MPLNPVISASQVDARSPIDDQLMEAILENLERIDLNTQSGQPAYQFRMMGPLNMVPGGMAKRVDGAFISYAQQFSSCRMFLDKPGSRGTLEIDLRRMRTPQTPIRSIAHQYSGNTNSVARVGAGLSTQSITRVTPQISTQSITRLKSALNVQSIISVGTNLWQFNLDSSPDSDWEVGDSVLSAGCTAGGNNGTFVIVKKNNFGGSNIVVENASGVAQAGVAGTLNLQAFSYNFTNPVSSEFVAGESALFASHTAGGNNGTLEIYAVNRAGNNLVVKNASGETQGAAFGTADVLRFSYNMAASVASDYVVGETLAASGHAASNNGNLRITAVNSGGNNVQVYNASGSTTGVAAGTVNTNRWEYALATAISSNIVAGDSIVAASHTSGNNNGTFEAVAVGASSVTVHNESGAAQGGAAGTVVSAKKVVSFASDQSAIYSTDSWVELEGTPDATYHASASSDLGYEVLEVNRGGGANYNIVIEEASGAVQSSPAGWVSVESRSILTTRPKIDVTPDYDETEGQSQIMTQTTEAVFVDEVQSDGSKIGLYVLSVPEGDAESLVVQLK